MLAVCTVCNVAQRNFWLNFMEEFDKVFMATRALLVSPARLDRPCKESLLSLYTSMFRWSAAGQPKLSVASSQT